MGMLKWLDENQGLFLSMMAGKSVAPNPEQYLRAQQMQEARAERARAAQLQQDQENRMREAFEESKRATGVAETHRAEDTAYGRQRDIIGDQQRREAAKDAVARQIEMWRHEESTHARGVGEEAARHARDARERAAAAKLKREYDAALAANKDIAKSNRLRAQVGLPPLDLVPLPGARVPESSGIVPSIFGWLGKKAGEVQARRNPKTGEVAVLDPKTGKWVSGAK
jgi:hypothetical protein